MLKMVSRAANVIAVVKMVRILSSKIPEGTVIKEAGIRKNHS